MSTGKRFTHFAAGRVQSARRSEPPPRPAAPFSCACCGLRLRTGQVASTTKTRLLTLVWCTQCHTGQHWFNFGIAAGEVKP